MTNSLTNNPTQHSQTGAPATTCTSSTPVEQRACPRASCGATKTSSSLHSAALLVLRSPHPKKSVNVRCQSNLHYQASSSPRLCMVQRSGECATCCSPAVQSFSTPVTVSMRMRFGRLLSARSAWASRWLAMQWVVRSPTHSLMESRPGTCRVYSESVPAVACSLPRFSKR